MENSHEEILGTLLMLVFPLVMGFAVAVSIYTDGMCLRSLIMRVTWLASLGYLWCLPSIRQTFGKRRRVLRDERDVVVFKNAAFVAHGISWLYCLLTCLVLWRLVGTDGSVSVNTLPIVFVGGIVVFQWAFVVGSLIQDRMGHPHRA